jgi:hypothetical protein
MPAEVFDWLRRRLKPTDVVIELGSGEGTGTLATFSTVFTVEHDPAFLDKQNARYIHAPIVNNWYDPIILGGELPGSCAAVIVDGPPGAIGRQGLLDHLDLFPDVPFLFDDVNRRAEFDLAVSFAKAREKNISIHYLTSGRAFATVGWANA